MRVLLSEWFASAPQKRQERLNVTWNGSTAEINLGSFEFFVRTACPTFKRPETYDFALFGALAIALRNNIDIEFHLPVTQAAARAAAEIQRLFHFWCVRECYPVQIKLLEVIDMPGDCQDRPSVFCFSGGIDSTYSALALADAKDDWHAMLVAGADYPSAHDAAFRELASRCRNICESLRLEFFVSETSIRHSAKLNWQMSHTLVLAMMLSFHKAAFRTGGISADFTLDQEFGYHPWGNSTPVLDKLNGGSFAIKRLSDEIGRTEKVRRISGSSEKLMELISVCYKDKTTGGNCGVCGKCIRTKLNIVAAGYSLPQMFLENPPLDGLVGELKIPRGQIAKRREYIFLYDAFESLPDGLLSSALQQRLEKLRKLIVPIGRI